MQDTPPSRVPPSTVREVGVGVDCTVHAVPFQRSASVLVFLPLRVLAIPVAVHCDRPVQDTAVRTPPLKPRLFAVAAIRACGVIMALAPAVARPQGTNRWRAGLFSRATALLTGVPAAALADAAVAAWAAGDAAAPAGPAASIAPPRTVAVIPAPSAAVAIRVLAPRLIPCPVMHSSVGLPPGMTSNTSRTSEPARRFAPICKGFV